jgi:hypothetical protein
MAEYKHQEQDLRAGHQHLANLNQEASATPAVLIHQHQVALVAIQDLERQRLDLLTQHQVGEQPQSQQHQQ